MSHKEKIANPATPRPWTRPDDYIGALARKRSFRRDREPKLPTHTERPRLLLSTAPFLALMALLGVLAIAIMVVAFPGTQPQVRDPAPVAKEKGVAPKGWFGEARREFHRQS